MPLFSVSRARASLSLTADLLTIKASGTKPLRISVVDIKGMDSSSSVNEIVMQRSSGGTTGGGASGPAKVDPASAAARFNVYTTWSVQPTLDGDILWRFGPNANGGIDKDVATPGWEWPVPVGGQVSFRSTTGTGNVTINLRVEEIDG